MLKIDVAKGDCTALTALTALENCFVSAGSWLLRTDEGIAFHGGADGGCDFSLRHCLCGDAFNLGLW